MKSLDDNKNNLNIKNNKSSSSEQIQREILLEIFISYDPFYDQILMIQLLMIHFL